MSCYIWYIKDVLGWISPSAVAVSNDQTIWLLEIILMYCIIEIWHMAGELWCASYSYIDMLCSVF